MTRRRMTSLRRARIFDSHGGTCHLCGVKIAVGEAWEAEHIIALEISGDDSDDNLAPAHVACHRAKTAEDVGRIAKARRVYAKHIGAHRSKRPLPGGRGSPWKCKVNGPTVRRDEE
jgi:5-methylcytosine-specific restriction protein A